MLGHGCVQEEIRFVVCPECLVSRLFVEVLADSEAVSILGAEREAYALYASQVRREYGHVNWLYWRIGRSQFLSSSTSKRVFCTSEFAGLEGKALENARAECLKLRLELFVAACVAVAGLGAAGRVMLSLL